MTLEDVVAVVESETGKPVEPETKLDDLGMDSLDFLSLIVAVGGVPDLIVPRINTVNDLYLAASGQL